jgi:hypothetical protein
MTRVVVDDVLLSRLRNLTEPLELCDPSGRVLGRVVPVLDRAKYEGTDPQIGLEEIERRKANKGKGLTTAQVLARLE